MQLAAGSLEVTFVVPVLMTGPGWQPNLNSD
jgi:hypothetical protein